MHEGRKIITMNIKKTFLWLLLISFGLVGCSNTTKPEAPVPEDYQEPVSEDFKGSEENSTIDKIYTEEPEASEDEIASNEASDNTVPESAYTPYEVSDVPKLETCITLEAEKTSDIILAKNPIGNLEAIDDFEAKFAAALGGPSIDIKYKEISRTWDYDRNNFTGAPLNYQKTEAIIGKHDLERPIQIYKIEYTWDNSVSLQPRSLGVECSMLDNINNARSAFETAAKGAIHEPYLNAMLNEVTELTTEPDFEGCVENSFDTSMIGPTTDGPEIYYQFSRHAHYPVKDSPEEVSYPYISYKCYSSRNGDVLNPPASTAEFEGYITPEEAIKDFPLDVTKLTPTYNPMALTKYLSISTNTHIPLVGNDLYYVNAALIVRAFDENNSSHDVTVQINENDQLSMVKIDIHDIPALGTDSASAKKQFVSLVKKYLDYDLKEDEYYFYDEESGGLHTEIHSKLIDEEVKVKLQGSYSDDHSFYNLSINFSSF